MTTKPGPQPKSILMEGHTETTQGRKPRAQAACTPMAQALLCLWTCTELAWKD